MDVEKQTLSYDHLTYRVLYTCFALLTFKILLMVPLTVKTRFSKKTVMNPEDCKLWKGLKVRFDDPDVERIRRAHLNDLENIPVFVFCSYWYAALKPNPFIAIPLIVIYTLSRFAHTYVYAIKVTKQPARFICFAIGFVITAYIAAYLVIAFKD